MLFVLYWKELLRVTNYCCGMYTAVSAQLIFAMSAAARAFLVLLDHVAL